MKLEFDFNLLINKDFSDRSAVEKLVICTCTIFCIFSIIGHLAVLSSKLPKLHAC